MRREKVKRIITRALDETKRGRGGGGAGADGKTERRRGGRFDLMVARDAGQGGEREMRV